MTPDYSNEINLIDLFLIIRKKFKLLIILFLFSIIVSAIISYSLKPVFRCNFIVRMPAISASGAPQGEVIVSSSEAETIIKGLEILRKEQNFADLSQRLKLNQASTVSIVNISASSPVNSNNLLEITVDVHDPSIINELKSGLLDYLNQIIFSKKRFSLQKGKLFQLKKDMETSIKDMEDLKDSVSLQIKRNGIKFLGFNPLQMNREVVEFRHQLQIVENEIALLRGVEVVTEPVIPRYPIRPKKLFIIGGAAVTSLFAGIFAALAAEWVDRRKKLTAKSDLK